jgi:carbon storage regulator
MLVLSRKFGERILIPQFELTFSVVGIDGNTVKLGITAPTNVSVYRDELWRKVRMEQGAPGSWWHGPPDALSLLALRR